MSQILGRKCVSLNARKFLFARSTVAIYWMKSSIGTLFTIPKSVALAKQQVNQFANPSLTHMTDFFV